MALALTASLWAYVPSFLVTELASEMKSPADLRKSIVLSAVLNATVFLGVGLPIASAWGLSVEDPISLSAYWPSRAPAARAHSGVLALANYVGFCLDSVPLARWCQRR